MVWVSVVYIAIVVIFWEILPLNFYFCHHIQGSIFNNVSCLRIAHVWMTVQFICCYSIFTDIWVNLLLCLIRYCECFASGIYCDGCNCVNCHNNVENEAARREAVEATLERNPNAFRPKIASSPHGTRDNKVCRSFFFLNFY